MILPAPHTAVFTILWTSPGTASSTCTTKRRTLRSPSPSRAPKVTGTCLVLTLPTPATLLWDKTCKCRHRISEHYPCYWAVSPVDHCQGIGDQPARLYRNAPVAIVSHQVRDICRDSYRPAGSERHATESHRVVNGRLAVTLPCNQPFAVRLVADFGHVKVVRVPTGRRRPGAVDLSTTREQPAGLKLEWDARGNGHLVRLDDNILRGTWFIGANRAEAIIPWHTTLIGWRTPRGVPSVDSGIVLKQDIRWRRTSIVLQRTKGVCNVCGVGKDIPARDCREAGGIAN